MALGAVLITYGLEQWAQSKHEFFFSYRALTNYLTGATLVLALGVKLLRGDSILQGYPAVGKLTLSLFGVALLSLFWTVYPEASFEQWARHWPYVVAFVILSPLLLTHTKDLRIGFMTTLLFGTIILLLLMIDTQWVGRQIVLSRGVMVGTVISRYGNPLAVASLAGYVALIALLLNFSGVSRFWQIARWGIVALGLAVSIRSGSRGQLFALLVAAIAFLPMSRRITNIKGFIATACGVGIMLFVASWTFEAFSEGERWRRDSMVGAYQSGRVQQSLILLEYWLSRPAYWLLGLGNSASFDPGIIGLYPHVVLVEVLAEEGVVGFVLLWLVVILSFRSLFHLYRYLQADPHQRGLLAALGALFLFEVILSFKQGSLLGNTHAFTFAIMIGRFERVVAREAVSEPFREVAVHDDSEQHLFAT